MLTLEDQEANRQERLNEAGTMPPCPFCHKPRVERSDYIRCPPCATNWLDGEDISKDPRIERYSEMVESQRKASKPAGRQGTE